MSGNKTELPTPKRIEDSRKKGDLPFSRDIGSVAGLIMSVAICSMSLGDITQQFAALYDLAVRTAATGHINALDGVLYFAAQSILENTAKVGCIGALVVIAINLIQTRFSISFDPIIPNLNKINPVEGVKKLFSIKTLFDLAKTILLALAVGLAIGFSLKAKVGQMLILPRANSISATTTIWYDTLIQLFAVITAILFFFALVDFMFQRHHWTEKHRMTRQEIIDEFKEQEGSPEVKGARKQLGQEFMEPKASEVLQYANLIICDSDDRWVALIFQPNAMPLPIVVAKGVDRQRRAELSKARDLNIFFAEDTALTAKLYARAQPNQFIPGPTVEDVAAWYARVLPR